MRANESEGLNAFESRLAAWRPASDGLDTDRLLLAAGRASVRGRRAWPIAVVFLAFMALYLGQRLLSERAEHLSERLAMQSQIDRLAQSTTVRFSMPREPDSASPPDAETATYRAGDRNMTDDFAQTPSTSFAQAPDPKPLHVWQLDRALEP
jgi:hypothetical protein